MMNAREAILESIRKGLKSSEMIAPVRKKIDIHITPQRVQVSDAALLILFIAKATAVSATVAQCNKDNVAIEIKRYLQQKNHESIRVAPALADISWNDLKVNIGAAEESDNVAITEAFAAIAETGTLLCRSAPETPTLLNFLPETSIIIVAKKTLVATYEDAWKKLQVHGVLPRTVNFITGPSRTSDIEQKLLLGIHGPKRLHIIILNKEINDH